MMGVMATGMVPAASQVTNLPSGVIPGATPTVPPQCMMGHPQQQGIMGAVAQPNITHIGGSGTMPHAGRIGL